MTPYITSCCNLNKEKKVCNKHHTLPSHDEISGILFSHFLSHTTHFHYKKAKSTFLLERTRDSIFYGEKNHSSKEIGHHADAL